LKILKFFRLRPNILSETIKNVLNDIAAHPPDKKPRAGIEAEREEELLKILIAEK